MKVSPYALLAIIGISLILTVQAQQKPGTGKAPSWVSVNQYHYDDSGLEHEAEDGYMDMVFERQISIAEQSVYVRKAIKILTESGIQNASEISVGFDPQYQKLIFHTIQIVRDDGIINKLDLSKIKTIQQEEDLKRFIYNGSLNSVLFLEDVRKGDLIEYSYTIKGSNPVFKNKFSASMPVEFGVPIANIYYKVTTPKQTELQFKNNHTSVQPVISERAGEKIYEWKLSNTKALHVEDNTPGWYDPFGEIMLSEYKNWKEVNDWALELFPTVQGVSPTLSKKIEQINASAVNDEERILASLHFVQDDIRYMGIEMGKNSHKPQHPDKIFNQRFGDCKDKSYLLCTMLRQMNIEASPVLINTDYTKAIKDWLPSPKDFNHTTVRVKYNNKYYWFDATAALQRGRIADISYPMYAYGLVVAPGTEDLTSIDAIEPGMVKVKEIFSIPDMSGNAKLKVVTAYSGSFADNIRNDFNANSNYEMRKSFQDYYASYYKDITIDSLIYTDHDAAGVFTTTEYYSIKNLWQKEGKVKKAFFDPYVIDGIIHKPKETKRLMPYSLTYPAKYKETVEINVPDDWTGDEAADKIQTEYLFVKANFSYQKRKFTLNYEYENLQDHITPDQVDDFLKAMKKKEDNFGYQIFLNESKDASNTQISKTNSAYAVLLRLGAMLLVAGGIFLWNKRRCRG